MASADEEEAMQGSTAQGDERILVSVRLRPLNDKEASRKEAVDWECIDDNTIIYNNHSSPERSLYPNSFTFDRVFRCHCSTRQVYEEGAKAVVLSAVSGINSSVFAYGQTSSGKTFTMSGITEYTMEDIFDYINKHKERDFHLKFSAMEIYNESVRDLLTADNSPLRLLDDPERGTVVEKLTEESLRDWLHFKELLAICEAQRQIGETFLNEASSRSHQILRLTIESSTREFLGKNNRGTLAATLNFVDLAGSERASQALSAGSRLKEGSHINRSLLTLGTVIRKLSKGQTGHIPYRDSKLTRILQSSLGGNARTAVICTMSPARSYVEQSRNTLLFASCAKEVTTDARVNVVMSDKALVKHLQRELVRLESELRSASPSGRSDATEILKEKDFKIEELETRVKELTLRLDLALSQIHNLQQGVEEQRPVWEEASTYPMLHVRNISEGSCSNTSLDHHSFSARSLASGNPQSPDRHSRLSYDENYSVSDIDENQNTSNPFEQMFIEIPNDASPSMHIQTPVFVGFDHQGFREQTPSVSEADQGIVTEEPERQNPNLFESDQYIVSEEPEERNSNLFKSDQYIDSEEPEGRNPNLFKSDQYIDSEEPEGRNLNLSKSDQYIVSEEPQVRNLNSFQSDQYIVSEKPEVRNPNSFESDQYIVSEEPERHNLNSFESDQNIVSEESERHNLNSFESDLSHRSVEIEMENCDTFEIHLHQDSDGYGSQSPYYVELDPYHVSGELREQTPNSFEANQYHVSDEMVEIMHKYDAFGPQRTPEAVREQDTTVEEYCKEVQCIESEISQGNLCSPEEERKSSLVTGCENAKHTDEEQRQATESGNMNFFLPQCCEVTSTRHQIDGAQTAHEIQKLNCVTRHQIDGAQTAHEIQKLNCVKDSSQLNDTSTNTSSLSPAEVKYEIKNENGDEECIRRLEQSHGKLSTLKTDVDYGVPHILNGDMVLDETKVADITVSDNIDDTDERHTSLSVKKEITEAVSIDQVPLQKFQDEDMHNKSKNSIKNMKDVGLNPQDDLEDRCPWSTDVSKLQREIIDLWDACNVPLVHRTYFLLLFVKDDQADTIYMEVERRRLSHIKDAFSRGNSIVLDGCQLTPGSSKRSLHSERKMLSKLMKRRFSSQERLDLYVRWGINLDSKRRSSQLAHRLWVNTVDMDHVMESAKVVAKLIRFSEPQVPKEVFGLNLTRTQGPRKSFKWACTNNVLSEVNH